MNRSRLQSLSLATIVGLTTGLAANVSADDTEIYLTPPAATSSNTIRPNVLFVLDTSSSMTSKDDRTTSRLYEMKEALKLILNDANNINVGLMRFHRSGGPVLYPVSYIDEDASVVEAGAATGPLDDIQVRIAQGSDDAEEDAAGTVTLDSNRLDTRNCGTSTPLEVRVSSGDDDMEMYGADATSGSPGTMYATSSDLELVRDGGKGNQFVGVRFTNVALPPGAEVLCAELEFEVDVKRTELTTLEIAGENAGDARAFETTNNDFGIRTFTTARTPWPNVAAPDVDKKLISPDIRELVQEVVKHDDWASGNAMAFFLAGEGKREVESYNGESGAAPLLRVWYKSGTTTPDFEQTIGLRFENVAIPQGVTIEDASIEFVASNSGNEATDITYVGHDVDDSPTFAGTNNELSSRITSESTTATVDDEGVAAWETDSKYKSPELKTIVEEITSRANWCGGNAMTFFVKAKDLGNLGLRSAESFEGEPESAPVLRVNYDEASAPSDGGCIRQTIVSQVKHDNDDAEEVDGNPSANRTMNLTSSDLEMVDDSGDQNVGIRFQNLRIPQGTTVLEASIQFTAKDSGSSTTSLTIEAEDIDDAPAFDGAASNISDRNTTSSSNKVTWSGTSMEDWVAGNTYRTPDLTDIVQEVVDRGGWVSGNSMAFVITGSGLRRAHSFDGNPAAAPVLRVKFEGELGAAKTAPLMTVRERLKQVVDNIEYKSGTPIVDTMYEAALYYRGNAVDYGLTRGTNTSDRSEFTRVSHPSSYTGGTINRPSGCTEDNLNATACRDETISGSPTYKSPRTSSCQSNYIILLTDGSPSVNTSADKVKTMTGATSCTDSGSKECGDELVQFLKDNEDITTYTIGFNFSSTWLQELATVHGGGEYQTANNAQQLADAFNANLAEILSRPSSFAAPTLSVNAFNRLSHINETYFALFKPTGKKRWAGNVKKYGICTEANDTAGLCTKGTLVDKGFNLAVDSNSGRITNGSTDLWSGAPNGHEITAGGAAALIPGAATRIVYTYSGANQPSVPADLTVVNDTNMTGEMLGDDTMSAADKTKLVNWIRGVDVNDEDGDNDATDARYAFADPLHSSPVAVTFGKHSGTQDPVTKLFVGTNDGGIRMINGHNGKEEWIFYPSDMLKMQKDLINDPNGDHVYGMDMTPTIWVNDDNGIVGDKTGEFVRLIVGMRRGGNDYYALDVTPSSTLTDRTSITGITPKFMWRIAGGAGDYVSLGQTWSKPTLTTIKYQGTSTKDVIVFGGGYNASLLDSAYAKSPTLGNAIYIADAKTGDRIWWASTKEDTAATPAVPASGADLELDGMVYAIPSALNVTDSDGDGYDDRIYVGDTGGQVWRIDLGDEVGKSGNKNGGSDGAIFAKLSENMDSTDPADAVNHRRFFHAPDLVEMRDSINSEEPRYDLVMITSGDHPNPLSKDVHDRFFALRDYNVDGQLPDSFTTLTKSDLYDATANLIQDGSTEAVRETELGKLKTKSGYYIDFKDGNDFEGEKGLSRPTTLEGRTFFTTYSPDLQSTAGTCAAAEGSSRLWGIYAANGKAVYPDWDEDGETGTLNKKDRTFHLNDGISPDVQSLFTDDGDILLVVGTSGGAQIIDPDIDTPAGKTYWRSE